MNQRQSPFSGEQRSSGRAGRQGSSGRGQGSRRQQQELNPIQLEGTQFWAHQFSEHFKFIINELKLNRDKVEAPRALMAQLHQMQARWAEINENPFLFTPETLDKTFELKEQVKGLVSGLECVPDLLTHMLEEASYYLNSVLEEKYTLQDEIAYWATEHAENIDFVNCQLPVLIRDHGLGPAPKFLAKVAADNAKLSAAFKEIAADNQEGFFAGIGKLFGFGADRSGEVDPKTLMQFEKLHMKHMNAVQGLIEKLPQIPLPPKLLSDLYEMLTHEAREAMFADARIKQYRGFQNINQQVSTRGRSSRTGGQGGSQRGGQCGYVSNKRGGQQGGGRHKQSQYGGQEFDDFEDIEEEEYEF
jgi:hypothetical protein